MSKSGEKEKYTSKVLPGIADSGKKVTSGGGNVVSGIKSSGGKAISGIASTGSKAVHSVTDPIGSVVRHTVDKANNALHHGNSSHGNSSHGSTSAEKEAPSVEEGKASSNDEPLPASKDEDVAEMKPDSSPSETTPAETPSSADNESPGEAAPIPPSGEQPKDSSHGVLGSMEAMANKLFVKPVKGTAEFVAEGGNKLLVNPAKATAQKVSQGGKAITERSKEALHIKSKNSSRDIDEDEQEEDLPDVPPDDTLKKMNVIINKRLLNVSIPDYYAIAWSEGGRTDKTPLYGPWLKESGKQDIDVGTWEFADDENEFVGDWDGEKYPQKRVSGLSAVLSL